MAKNKPVKIWIPKKILNKILKLKKKDIVTGVA